MIYPLIGTSFLALAMALLAMFYRGEMLVKEVQITSLVAEKQTLLDSMEEVKKVNDKVNDVLMFTLNMHKNQLGKADDYRNQITAAERETAGIILQLDNLKRTEHKRALERPLERGDAARGRIISIVCRAWGPNDSPQCSGKRSNGNAGTSDRGDDRPRTITNSSPNSSDDAGTSEDVP